MSEQQATPFPEHTPFNALPVTMTIPWCSLTLEQLSQLTVGQPLQLEDAQGGEVILTVQSCRIARGQLLQLQGRWAVRVYALEQ